MIISTKTMRIQSLINGKRYDLSIYCHGKELLLIVCIQIVREHQNLSSNFHDLYNNGPEGVLEPEDGGPQGVENKFDEIGEESLVFLDGISRLGGIFTDLYSAFCQGPC